MTKRSAFTAEILQDGHLSIPDQTMKALALRKGCKVRATLVAESFDREQFLQLFGIWKKKTEAEISVFRDILRGKW